MRDKKGQFQIASSAIWGVVGFLLAIVVVMLIVNTVVNGNFFTANSASQNTTTALQSNLTGGINTVVGYFPTLFTVLAIAIVLAIIGLLVLVVRRYGMGGGGGSFSQ